MSTHSLLEMTTKLNVVKVELQFGLTLSSSLFCKVMFRFSCIKTKTTYPVQQHQAWFQSHVSCSVDLVHQVKESPEILQSCCFFSY